MKKYSGFKGYQPNGEPLVLTIGNFDGLHLGHQTVLKQVVETAAQQGWESGVMTFANHPSTILRPEHSPKLLCTLEHRLKLIEQSGIRHLFLFEFTEEFSKQSAQEFLQLLQSRLPFRHLILGPDATIGKDREGNREKVLALSEQMSFQVTYIPELFINNFRVSSSQIRKLIESGLLYAAEKLLGRPYSIYAKVVKGNGKGVVLNFPTANIPVEGICLPPLGVYVVSVGHHHATYQGVANLGLAPTVRNNTCPVLEVHLLDFQKNLYGEMLEIKFQEFIRPEKKFASLELLKDQIEKDILFSRQFFKKIH